MNEPRILSSKDQRTRRNIMKMGGILGVGLRYVRPARRLRSIGSPVERKALQAFIRGLREDVRGVLSALDAQSGAKPSPTRS